MFRLYSERITNHFKGKFLDKKKLYNDLLKNMKL